MKHILPAALAPTCNSYPRPIRWGFFLAGIGAAVCLCFSALSATALAQSAPGVNFTTLYSFGTASTDGSQPDAPLIFGSGGNLYGSTQSGGTGGTGTIFQLAPTGVATTLHSFSKLVNNGNSDGVSPTAALVLGTDGNFYGVTNRGGANATGTIFKVTPSGTFTTIHTFNGNDSSYRNSDGVYPNGLILGSDGNFYGTTNTGGAYGAGTVFQLTPSGQLTTIYTFTGGADGGEPSTALAFGGDGNYYGVTALGGANSTGTFFEVTPSGVLTTLYSFEAVDFQNGTNSDGAVPYITLVAGSDGNFYGMTSEGGANSGGTVFKVTPAGALMTLYAFSDTTFGNSDGYYPTDLIEGHDGNLYGTTSSGGYADNGTVFELTPVGTFTTLYSFSGGEYYQDNSDGQSPTSIIQGGDGALYGTAGYGGAHASGTVFKIIVASPRFDFNQDGHSDLIWYNTVSGGVSVWDMDDQTVLHYGATFTSMAPSAGWVPVAAPDANEDGYPDLLWWNSKTGELTLSLLQNTTVTATDSDFAQIKNTNWKPVAVADESGGAWTMVLQNKVSGDIARWLMNGDKVVNVGPVMASLGPKSPWQVVGAPDLDGDGKSDLLFWNSQTGEVSYWSCDLADNQVLSYHGDFAQVSDTSWHLVGSEDTNGDGHPDLIWWNASSGSESRWLLNGTTVEQYGGGDAQVTDTTWQPTAIR